MQIGVEGLSKKEKKKLMNTDNSVMISGVRGGGRRGYGGINGDGRRLDLRW